MQPEDLSREVNRLYWETEEPVTRLAEKLGVSRGTFYNHLEPLAADGECESCGGALQFGSRSDRDNGAAQCVDCGQEQAVAPSGRSAGAQRERGDRVLHSEPVPFAADHTRESALLAERAGLRTGDGSDDPLRTQLLVVAVGAAVLGLAILFYTHRRR